MNSEPNLDRRARLREQLIELRNEALDRMIRRGAVEPGHLPLIAGINAALDGLDTMSVETTSAARAWFRMTAGRSRLRLYNKTGAVATVELSPARSVALAGRLLDAAGTKLALGEA